MGDLVSTAYYAIRPDRVCSECDRPHEDHRTKIGNSAVGWRFLFNGFSGVETRAEWIQILSSPLVEIRDEYGHTKNLAWFVLFTKNKQESGLTHLKYKDYHSDPEGYEFHGSAE